MMARSLFLTLLVLLISILCSEAYNPTNCYGGANCGYCAPPTYCYCEEPFPCAKICSCVSPPPKPTPPVENNPSPPAHKPTPPVENNPPPTTPKPTPPVEKNPPTPAAPKPNPPSPTKPQPPNVDKPSPSTPKPPAKRGHHHHPKCPNPRDYCQTSGGEFYFERLRKKCWCSLQQCEGCFAQIWTATFHDFMNVSKKCCEAFLKVDENCHRVMFERFGYKWFVYRLKQHCSRYY